MFFLERRQPLYCSSVSIGSSTVLSMGNELDDKDKTVKDIGSFFFESNRSLKY